MNGNLAALHDWRACFNSGVMTYCLDTGILNILILWGWQSYFSSVVTVYHLETVILKLPVPQSLQPYFKGVPTLVLEKCNAWLASLMVNMRPRNKGTSPLQVTATGWHYCHWVTIQLQLTNISYHIISYHIISYHIIYIISPPPYTNAALCTLSINGIQKIQRAYILWWERKLPLLVIYIYTHTHTYIFFLFLGWDSVDGIVTHYWLGSPGTESRWGVRLSAPNQPPIYWVPGYSWK